VSKFALLAEVTPSNELQSVQAEKKSILILKTSLKTYRSSFCLALA
jgi:hypothetical protein